MSKISDHIYYIIREKKFADPFSYDFDSDRLKSEFDQTINEDERNILDFIIICNSLFKDLETNIFELFDKIKLEPNDLREFCFMLVNKYFLDLQPHLASQLNVGVVHEIEKNTFSKFTNANGYEMNAQLAVEIGGDILAELIVFSQKWESNEKEFNTLNNLDAKIHGDLFYELWIYTNIFLNLKKSAYHKVKYENGKVIIRSKDEIKIETDLIGVFLLRNVGIIRTMNHVQDFFSKLISYNNGFKEKNGVSNFTLKDNVLSPIKGKVNSKIKLTAYSNLFASYPYFLQERLEYFDGLSLCNLLDLLVLIEECIQILSQKNLIEYSERQLNEIPIKFNEIELVNFLSEISGYKIETVNKFIASITTNINQPYFWREPLLKVGDFLYFSLAATIAVNHVLYFDKWTSLSGYTLEIKEKKFTDFILKQLIESEITQYKFEIIELDKLNVNSEIFKNTILIETTSLFILLEIKLFDFPIESPEISSAFSSLGKATLSVTEKANRISDNFNMKKKFVKIIITNYKIFSGLNINNIPIVDLNLFENYFLTGNLKRVAVTFHQGESILNDQGTISYYKNENEFNENVKSFFTKPLPITYILQRLCVKEYSITSNSIKPEFIIDIIDHITNEELMDSKIMRLTEYLNYKYFEETENKNTKDSLNQAINYSLHDVFNQLFCAPYESYEHRMELYYNISKTKLVGFSQLARFIFNALKKLNEKKIIETRYFDSIQYYPDEVLKILSKRKNNLSGNIRISEFEIRDKIFTDIEEKKIISFSIDFLSNLKLSNFNNQLLESIFFHLALLQGLSKRHNVEFEFYAACGNIISLLNYTHKYQIARNFCEEILVLSIKNNKQSHGWSMLFKCYTNQKSAFDASINGCLFLSSLLFLPEIPHFLVVEVLYESLKYFRNFGLTKLAKYTYKNLQHLDLNEYDKQKVTLSYFNSFFQGEIELNINSLDEIVNYVEAKMDDIIGFGELGVNPWLTLLYNIEKLKLAKQINYNRNIKKYISKLENSISKEDIDSIKKVTFGDKNNPRAQFISAVLSIFKTRNTKDFVHEVQNLLVIASNLLKSSIIRRDIDGILLTGLVINDQSFIFKDILIDEDSSSLILVNEEYKQQLNNYKNYLLNKINLKNQQLLIWLFEDLGKVYCLSVNSSKEFVLIALKNWQLDKMNKWIRGIENFYFNSKKGNFNNPRKEHDYNYQVQVEDYENLRKELVFASISIPVNVDELLVYSSINMASFPHNLIQNGNDFLAAKIPVCNVISMERFINNSEDVYLRNDYSISAWIPTDDQELVISWGFDLLEPILTKIKANIFKSTYPKEFIKSNLNVFLAHGVKESFRFKAIYTSDQEKTGIVFPKEIFGEGKVAILFICNSGSSYKAFFSNSVISFSGELLKSGYESVIAPFWSFDVTMSKIWLEEFLNRFNEGYSISESVWFANDKLSKYDSSTSKMFYAPSGCFAMHLYGNPNVYVEQ